MSLLSERATSDRLQERKTDTASPQGSDMLPLASRWKKPYVKEFPGDKQQGNDPTRARKQIPRMRRHFFSQSVQARTGPGWHFDFSLVMPWAENPPIPWQTYAPTELRTKMWVLFQATKCMIICHAVTESEYSYSEVRQILPKRTFQRERRKHFHTRDQE